MEHFSLLQGLKKIHDFFGTNVFFKMKLNNFLVGSFLSGIGLVNEISPPKCIH